MWPCSICVFSVMLCEQPRRPACDFRTGRTTQLLQSVWHRLEFCIRALAVPGALGVAVVVSNPWEMGVSFRPFHAQGTHFHPNVVFIRKQGCPVRREAFQPH